MRIFDFEYDGWVEHAQAHGCWAFVHLGRHAFFFGLSCPWGLRIVLTSGRKKVWFVRFDK